MTPDVADRSAEALAEVAGTPPPPELPAMNFAFTRARVLGTALELDLFTALADRPGDAAALAPRLGCDPPALARLLDVLVSLGLLERDPAGVLTPAEAARTHLVAGRQGFLGPHFAAVLEQWDRWADLTRVVRTGGRPGPLGDLAGRDRHAGMFGGNFPLAVGMVHRLAAAVPVPPGARVLDFLAGGGEWGICLAAAHPDATVVARDTPALLAGVRERVDTFGLTDRFGYVEVPGSPGPADASGPYGAGGSAGTGADPGGDHDVVVLAQVGRFVGIDGLAGLVADAAARLRPGGTFVLADVPAPEIPAAGPAAMLDLSLLVNTRHGGLVPRADLEDLLAGAGLRVRATATAGLLTALISER